MDKIRIVKGETLEGLFWIIVFQYGKAEFRCQYIEKWIDVELGAFFEQNANNLTLGEIEEILEGN